MCSCFGAFFAGICCGFCGRCSAVESGPISRLPYLFLFISAGVFSIVMSLYGEESLNLIFYDTQLCPLKTCMGTGSVYRTSFCLFLFELLHVIVIGAGCVAFHWLWFSWKFIFFIAALTCTFVINSDNSNEFFQGYANYFARFVSALYLILQILILIIWSYETNEFMVQKVDQYNIEHTNPDRDEDETGHQCNPWSWFFVLLTIAFYVITFTILGVFYHWYAPEANCAENITLITITIVLCVLNAVFSFIRADGSFFVSSVVSLYATFLLFAGLQSVDDKECNLLYTDNKGSLWIGYIISFLSIGYAALRADRIGLLTYDQHKENNDGNNSEYDQVEMNDLESDVETNKDPTNGGDKDSEKNKDDENIPPKQQLRKTHTFFHVILTLAACYYAMLFTNWAHSNKVDTRGYIALWVNVGSQWCCIGLFWWTLLAPKICPSRFPTDDEDDD